MRLSRRRAPWRIGSAVALAAAVAVGACERAPEKPRSALPTPGDVRLVPAAFDDLPGWSRDNVTQARPALRRSCARFDDLPADRRLGPGGYAGRVADWRAACDAVTNVPAGEPGALREALKANFVPFGVAGPEGRSGTFTGYYEATLEAARERGGQYQHPLYAPPKDLIRVELGRFESGLDGERIVGRVEDRRLVPYYSRARIDAGALDGKAEALLWADDPVDVFFLHVQGSGVARLPDGDTQRVGYAASNGRDFTAIGRELIASGELDGGSMSMQAIRDWLRAHPERARELMQRNPRYIFFREIDGAGPVGAFGVALTPKRSLAIDPKALPLGAPVWLATTHPANGEPLERLMVAQDTGNAITGTVRGDFFWGHGEKALAKAGRMKQQGRYWLLLPKAVVDRAQPAS